MARRVALYAMAAAISAAIVAAGVGPLKCGIYGCVGGANSSLATFWVGGAVGAVIGLIGMALIDIVVNGRYYLANRTEAKAQRLRDERRCATAPNPRGTTEGGSQIVVSHDDG
jgi:hypothetical protein